MAYNVGVIRGDGIGPEVVTEAIKVLDAVGAKFGHEFNYTEILMGGCSIDACGEPLTDEAIAAAKASDAVPLTPAASNGSRMHPSREAHKTAAHEIVEALKEALTL